MERFRYDRSSKWLIEHHGDSILRLAGVEDVIAWKALHAEVVQPRQLPDGLLEVERRGQPKKVLYLIEIETYADRQIDEQIMDDVMLIYQARRVVPEVALIVLCPKGNVKVLGQADVASPSGRTQVSGRWPVVELWKLSAQAMLALHEPGLIPWISLMDSTTLPEKLLQECREVIDAKAKPEELGNILAVSQILASLKYNDQWLFNFFGGKEAMIESPYLDAIIKEQVDLRFAKAMQQHEEEVAKEVAKKVEKEVEKEVAKQIRADIVRILRIRFGTSATNTIAALESVHDKSVLDQIADWAESCPDLASFQKKLPK